ncbi:tetratricopeptide repeat protein, partial [Streptomyces sp. NPDC056683]
MGRHAEALPLKERALAITEAALGPDQPTTAIR